MVPIGYRYNTFVDRDEDRSEYTLLDLNIQIRIDSVPLLDTDNTSPASLVGL